MPMQIGKQMGKSHKHFCSIPQGCPFSMTFVALLTLPWIKLMKDNSIVPRCLADGLYMQTHGPSHGSRIITGMKLSRMYFQDIATKVADGKCFWTSTCQGTSSRLRKVEFDNGGATIPVVNSFRDLGTHAGFDKTRAAPSMTKRVRKATKMARSCDFCQ